MRVQCAKCGNESGLQDRFCVMCGANLRQPPDPPTELPDRSNPDLPSRIEAIGGPSFLGLADQPFRNTSYLLEDDEGTHWGRVLMLTLLLGCVGAAAWHERHDLRGWAATKFSQRPGGAQTAQVSYSASPVSTSGSETAAGMPNAQALTEQPVVENPTPPAGQIPPAANNAEQENTVAATRTGTVPPRGQAPADGSQLTTATSPTKNEPSVAAGSPTREHSGKESAGAPAGPNAQTTQDQGGTLETQGERYLYEMETPANCARARGNLLAAAERSSAKAESVLGTMYATGHCVTRDLPLAYRWFAKALQQDPSNNRLEHDLRLLWNQMEPVERQIAAQRE